MIETISHLLKEANAQHMQLIIRAKEDGTVSVIANTVLAPYSDKQDKKTLDLRAALSTPLVTSGEAGHVDIGFQEALTQYAMAFTEGATLLNNATQAAAKIDKASKKAAKRVDGATNTPQESAQVPSNNTTSETAAPSTEPNLDDFMSGAAESL